MAAWKRGAESKGIRNRHQLPECGTGRFSWSAGNQDGKGISRQGIYGREPDVLSEILPSDWRILILDLTANIGAVFEGDP